MLASSLFTVLVATALVHAAPLAPEPRATSQLSATDLSGFAPFTQFARAAYCPISKLKNWSCGEACKALGDFTPTLVGGNGNDIQQYIVGYWASQNSVVVSHQGTDPTKFESILTDIDVVRDPLDSKLFPGVASSVHVHGGFGEQHALTANIILAEVKSLFAAHGTSNLVLVGHSLGGALAELDSLFFTLQIPSARIKTRTYGTPRVGNPAFAELIDTKVPDFLRINNRDDIIPIIPGRSLGFAHPEGEVHLISKGYAVACEGNDNAVDKDCQIKSVPNIFVGNILDHLGPYEGISIGSIFCN